MLNLTHARTFLTVMAARGFGPPRVQLDLAPSTIMDHIRQLEEVLAAPLVLRQRGGAMLTDQGARFLPLARSLVETAGRVRSLVHLPDAAGGRIEQRRHLFAAASSGCLSRECRHSGRAMDRIEPRMSVARLRTR